MVNNLLRDEYEKRDRVIKTYIDEKADEVTVKNNDVNNKFFVPIDNETIYIDEDTGLIKSAGSGEGVTSWNFNVELLENIFDFETLNADGTLDIDKVIFNKDKFYMYDALIDGEIIPVIDSILPAPSSEEANYVLGVDNEGHYLLKTIGDASFIHYIGNVDTFGDLPPIEDTSVGDLYYVVDEAEGYYNLGGVWTLLAITITFDPTVTEYSTNGVQSSGIYSFVMADNSELNQAISQDIHDATDVVFPTA